MQVIPYRRESIQPAQITLVQATYNGNDAGGPAATGLPADTWAVLGQPMVLASTFPSREGYRFLSWNTAANGQGTSYQPGETIPSVTGDITLFAQWEGIGPAMNYVEYYNNAPYPPAYNMPAPTPVVGGNTVISTQIPIRPGYTFAGWNTSPEGIGVTYQPGQTVTGLDAGLGLYAMWTPDGSGGECNCGCNCGCTQENYCCNFRPECWCHRVC